MGKIGNRTRRGRKAGRAAKIGAKTGTRTKAKTKAGTSRGAALPFALCTLADAPAARRAGCEPVLCPVLEHVDPADAPLIACLPVFDANRLLMSSLERLKELPAAQRPTTAAFFAADPFLHADNLFALLRQAGVTAVVNFPSVQVFDGAFSDNLDRVGCGFALELERLLKASVAGFDVHGLILSEDAAQRLRKAGLDGCVLSPFSRDKSVTSLDRKVPARRRQEIAARSAMIFQGRSTRPNP